MCVKKLFGVIIGRKLYFQYVRSCPVCFFLRSTQTFVGPLLILNTFVEIMCCSSFHTSHAVMRTTCSSAHKSFLPFNRSVCLGVLWIRNMCGSDLKSVCVCTRAQRSLVCAADSPVEWLKVRHQRPNSSAGFMFIPPPLRALLQTSPVSSPSAKILQPLL